jgi:hypothetical protein
MVAPHQMPTSTRRLQEEAADWLMIAFPEDPVVRPKVRASRFLEEALELVQTQGITREKAHELVDFVFDRPVGDPDQELGGTMFCLMAVANALGMDAGLECSKEILNAYQRIPQIRAKSKLKPKVDA